MEGREKLVPLERMELGCMELVSGDEDVNRDALVPLEYMAGLSLAGLRTKVLRESRSGNHPGAVMVGCVAGVYAAVYGLYKLAEGCGWF